MSEESMQHKKYAAWKSTYLMNCFRQGITPIPGPVGGNEEEEEEDSNQQVRYVFEKISLNKCFLIIKTFLVYSFVAVIFI